MQHALNKAYDWLDALMRVERWDPWMLYVLNIIATSVLVAVFASLGALAVMTVLPGPDYYFRCEQRRAKKVELALEKRYPEEFHQYFSVLADEVKKRAELRAARRNEDRNRRAAQFQHSTKRISRQGPARRRAAGFDELLVDKPDRTISDGSTSDGNDVAEYARFAPIAESGQLTTSNLHPASENHTSTATPINGASAASGNVPNTDRGVGSVRDAKDENNSTDDERKELNRLLEYIFYPSSDRKLRWRVFNSVLGFKVRRFVQVAFLPFGAYLLGVDRNPVTWVRSIFRFWAVLLATILVLWARPVTTLPSYLTNAWGHVSDWFQGTTPTRLLPFALLILGILMFARHSTLIDSIRARDEAAKDANKLLAQLLGQLIPVAVELKSSWCDRVNDSYWRELAQFVHDVSGGTMVMELRDIVPKALSVHKSPDSYEPLTNVDLESLVDGIVEVQREILKKGLVSVAARLTKPKYLHVREVGLLPIWSYPLSDRLNERLCMPTFLDRRRTTLLRRSAVLNPDLSSACTVNEIWAAAAKFAAERNLYSAQVRVSLCSIEATIRYLERRIAGRWWLRMLSIVAK